MLTEGSVERRFDRSAMERLVHGFGLLMLKDDFERYLVERSRFANAVRHKTLDSHVPLDEQNLIRFVPLLPLLGIKVCGKNPQFHYIDELAKMQDIEAFLMALRLTVDFSLNTAELHKKLKRKFESEPDKSQVRYRTKQLIETDLLKQCREVMWVVEEFRQDDDHQRTYDSDLWTEITKADSIHRETGLVSREFFQHLARYQSSRGDGKPRKYLRTALAVLLAECFVAFGRDGFEPQIHDRCDPSDVDQYGKVNTERVVHYESKFADFLMEYVQIIGFMDEPSALEKSLDHFRKILRLRVDRQTPSISHYLRSSLTRKETSEIIGILDRLKF